MSYWIIDLILLAVLLLFAAHGLRRGLILSLFSLLSVLVALAGALVLSNLWADAAAQRIQPLLLSPVTSAVEAALPDKESSGDRLVAALEEAQLPFGLEKYLPAAREDAAGEEQQPQWLEQLCGSLTEKLAASIARNGLFLLCFVLILILWKLLARTLDLVARLPGLHTLNRLGGFLLGTLRGALLLFLLAWLARWLWSDLIPAEAMEHSVLLRFFMTFRPLEQLEMI